jgi:hypothetical protein
MHHTIIYLYKWIIPKVLILSKNQGVTSLPPLNMNLIPEIQTDQKRNLETQPSTLLFPKYLDRVLLIKKIFFSIQVFLGYFVAEPPQKWGVQLPRSRSGDSWWSENACKHTYEAFKTIISLKIKLLQFILKITMMRSRRCFKRWNMFAEVFHLMIKSIHLTLEVKTSFSNSTPAMGSSTESSS